MILFLFIFLISSFSYGMHITIDNYPFIEKDYFSLKERYEKLPLAVSLAPECLGFKGECLENYPRSKVYRHTGIEKKEFLGTLHKLSKVLNVELFTKKWVPSKSGVSAKYPLVGFFDLNKNICAPYCEKHIIDPQEPVFLIGDLHGDVHSLLKLTKKLLEDGYLDEANPFKINPAKKMHLVIQGDCNDSGIYSIELWDLIFRFKIANPDNIHIIRGNHEHYPQPPTQSGFHQELRDKLELEDSEAKSIHNFYNWLPVALFIGTRNNIRAHTDYALLSHAGIEHGYRGHNILLGNRLTNAYQLIGQLNRTETIKELPCDIKKSIGDEMATLTRTMSNNQPQGNYYLDKPDQPAPLGFMYHYYIDDNGEKICQYNHAVGTFDYGKKMTAAVLKLWSNNSGVLTTLTKYFNMPLRKLFNWGFNKETYSVITNIRSHQHAMPHEIRKFPIMKKIIEAQGLYKQWTQSKKQQNVITPGSVFTTICAPVNAYGYPHKLDHVDDNKNYSEDYLQLHKFAAMTKFILADDYRKWSIQPITVDVFTENQLYKSSPKVRFVGIDSLDKEFPPLAID